MASGFRLFQTIQLGFCTRQDAFHGSVRQEKARHGCRTRKSCYLSTLSRDFDRRLNLQWNGFGGKFEADVDTDNVASALREVKEECGLELQDMHHLGCLLFVADGRERSIVIDVFVATQWHGEPKESVRPSRCHLLKLM